MCNCFVNEELMGRMQIYVGGVTEYWTGWPGCMVKDHGNGQLAPIACFI